MDFRTSFADRAADYVSALAMQSVEDIQRGFKARPKAGWSRESHAGEISAARARSTTYARLSHSSRH